MRRKLLSIILALTMALGMLPAAALAEDQKGTKGNPYSLEELGAMTRNEYIEAQKTLGGTMYVDVGNYSYTDKGVLGNGKRDDTTGQKEDRSVLNGYNSNGYLGEKNDGANGKNIVFVGGKITSGATGYTSIDKIGTSLLLAVPAYTNVTFEGTEFNNVMSFDYQLYTGPWSQLGELKFDGCTFNGIIVGAIAAQKLTFNGCEFKNYTNTTDANSSNPTWIRPAYGNWTKDDNKGQGDDFRSLTTINFTDNKVTSTRPVKFEYISQWDITSTVTATDNHFDISAQTTDKPTEIKNVGLYLGAHTDANAFDLVVDNNTKSDNTAALYTIPKNQKSLPAGSTVKDSSGNEIELTDALKWKGTKDDVLTLKTAYTEAAVAGINGVSYDSLTDAIAAAKDGDVITILVSDPYKLNGSLNYKDKAITIKAADGVNAKFDMSGGAVALHNAKLTFEGVTFDYYPNRNYIGIQHTDTMTYNNCTFNGQFFLYANSETFNHCTFKQESSDAYNVWTYGAKNVNFNDCMFNCAGKAVLVYNEGSNESTDVVVEDTSFIASKPVDGKAAIEIDTSLMKGQTKITADQATADKTTGFGTGSNSLNSLWNDKKQTAETNKNTTVVVAGKTVFEPTCIDLDAFLKMVESSGYTFDGTRADGSKLTVKWSPVSGCFDTRAGHNCTVNNVKATGNTPARENSKLAQFQVFDGQRDVTIKNVNFVYVAADFTVCANSNWACSKTADEVKTAQLFLLNSGNTTVEGCSFDKVVFTSWQNIGKTVIKDSEFKNIYDSYAIKDLGGSSAEVSNCTFENCGGGIMLDSNSIDRKDVTPAPVAISGNTFTNVDVDGTASEGKAGTRGLLQIPNKGDYTKTDIILDGNDSKNCGPILRQLNEGVANDELLSKNLSGDLAGLGGELTFTSDSVKKTGEEEPAKPTIYTVKFSGSDVADMKVVSGTVITLPTPTKDGYTFKGWTLDGSAINTATYEIKADTTFTAVWERDSGSSGSSTSAVTAPKADHGTVTVSPKRASKGDTVTVTVKPDSGYVLETLTVTDKNGNELTLKDKGNGKYTFTMPRSAVTVKATFMEDNTVLNFFYDVPNDAYYYEAVKWAVEKGITSGIGNDLFGSNDPCTRAQIVTFLWRAAGSPEPKALSSFTDVPADTWYAKAVAWAVENGVTAGVGDGLFGSDDTCTRAQSVTFLFKALKATAKGQADFKDVSASDWYAKAVAWAVENGVTAGVGGGLFGSGDDCTRAQIVTFLFKAYQGK